MVCRVVGRFICWSVRVWRPRWGAGGDYCPFTLTLALSQKERGPWIPRLIVASLQRREREARRGGHRRVELCFPC